MWIYISRSAIYIVSSLGDRIVGAFSIHSYGQEIYHPVVNVDIIKKYIIIDLKDTTWSVLVNYQCYPSYCHYFEFQGEFNQTRKSWFYGFATDVLKGKLLKHWLFCLKKWNFKKNFTFLSCQCHAGFWDELHQPESQHQKIKVCCLGLFVCDGRGPGAGEGAQASPRLRQGVQQKTKIRVGGRCKKNNNGP